MWHAKTTGGYVRTSQEALDNATMLANALTARGWSVIAIAALLGNGAGESGLNPWRWESDYVPTVSEFQSWDSTQEMSHGYGIFGFTPARKYINNQNQNQYSIYGYAPNFSDRAGNATDGNAQTLYFMSTVESSWSHNLYSYYEDDFAAIGIDINAFYWVTYQDFIRGVNGQTNMTLNECVGAFELCYEKPADWAAASSYQTRCDNADYWYQYLLQHPPVPIIVQKQNRLPIWMYAF